MKLLGWSVGQDDTHAGENALSVVPTIKVKQLFNTFRVPVELLAFSYQKYH